MRKFIGLLSQINLFVLIFFLTFGVIDLFLLKTHIINNNVTLGIFYIRDLCSIFLAFIFMLFFVRIENRYKKE